METATTTLIDFLDLINISKDLAQLNLGYLGISVVILGVFVYFNIKPMQEKLGKQEDAINDLKKEANDLLGQADIQTKSSLKEFEEKQTSLVSTAFDQQKENIYLEVTNKIQIAESNILEKVNSISNDKDLKLKEILLSEMSNKILSIERSLTALLEEHKKTNSERFSLFEKKTNTSVNKIAGDLLELKAYKYDMEGKMGGIIFTIEAVEKCFRDEPYLLKYKLEDLKGKIGKYSLTPELFIRLKNTLKSIESTGVEHANIIKEIRDAVTLQEKPEM
ncbi:MAG: hypothetical protein AAB455_01530 [Patescibacteria group bacterium]